VNLHAVVSEALNPEARQQVAHTAPESGAPCLGRRGRSVPQA
jgi:hypothetical protein